MSSFVVNSKIINGHLEIDNIPLPNDSEVKVYVISKMELSKMSFKKVQELTKDIQGNLSDDIIAERGER
jgi:hypothetical protein